MTYFAKLRALVADDAWAISFQTLGQYRNALLKAIDDTARKQTTSSAALVERFYEDSARIDSVVFLGGMLCQSDALSEPLRRLLEEDDDTLRRCFPDLHEGLLGGEEVDAESFFDWAMHVGKLGFVLQFSTPVMRHCADGGMLYSWGHYRTEWVYGDTFEDAMKRGFEWVKTEREREVAQQGSK